MVRENQLVSKPENNDSYCRPCDRVFISLDGGLNHCRNADAHRGEWCERCKWLFVSPQACQYHVDNSHRHNVCVPCDLDFGTAALLRSHDVEVHNMCAECGKYFNNPNDLTQHKRSHLPLKIECLGCDRMFSEFAAMMIHLESGKCVSGIDRDDVDNYIFDTYERCGTYVNHWLDDKRYQCPDCATDFRFASALCQHVATNGCDQPPMSTFHDIEKSIKLRI
ncbi:hypothetical protein AYO21_04751 [Fonsecaea monophora]|uniref:C2H2-type domain-containing protein n=1 Tax=Fonsecaea monophora TaxID=254056 RepID=A0A177FCI0_9EURO|nr:hypothetical protein AYO21_04751 [Fonsecaea monophora]OAG40909.1 hypothetical protein AYO21_04751 [Fonsecaea monophora]